MTQKPTYAIIIPHYNAAVDLSNLLATIPKDDRIQVIVVDDNSTQGDDILEQVIDSDARCEFYRNNSGIQSAGACRNEGLRHAKGEWILFADADDLFLDGFLEVIERYKDRGEDMIIFCPTSCDVETGLLSDRHLLWQEAISKYQKRQTPKNRARLQYTSHEPWSKMIKRCLIEHHQIEFAQTLVYNDVLFAARVGCAIKNFGVSDDKIYCVLKRKGSLSTLRGEKIFDIRTQAFLECYLYMRDHLPKKEMRLIPTRGAQHLMDAYLNHMSLRKLWEITKLFRQNHVKMLKMEYFNPSWFFRALKGRFHFRKMWKKYDTPGPIA
ncbi:MAG: glycosyltransferase [Clostridium sp.]|jgi:glycosyltransferase involved in cell wall biosynthesis|nr:glycosyltransferase [Clostridium sp.]